MTRVKAEGEALTAQLQRLTVSNYDVRSVPVLNHVATMIKEQTSSLKRWERNSTGVDQHQRRF